MSQITKSFWRLIGAPVLLGFIFLSGYLFYYLGGWISPTINLAHIPTHFVIYKNHLGPYHKMNDIITEVEKWAQEHKVPCSQTFGEYLDNPREVEEDRLKSRGGCLIPENSNSPTLKDLILNSASLPKEFHFHQIESGCFITALYSGSPAIAPWRVYPQLKKQAAEKKVSLFPVLEIYTLTQDQKLNTKYLVRIKSSDCEPSL
ncbi:MAG: hypothetical protein K1X29_03280 [Bdellovibrionales bacterium]|nr:hypothetical protein [Bdellovibrionales bacterium]